MHPRLVYNAVSLGRLYSSLKFKLCVVYSQVTRRCTPLQVPRTTSWLSAVWQLHSVPDTLLSGLHSVLLLGVGAETDIKEMLYTWWSK